MPAENAFARRRRTGWLGVLLPDGRRAYRYDGSDDLIIHKGTATETPASD